MYGHTWGTLRVNVKEKVVMESDTARRKFFNQKHWALKMSAGEQPFLSYKNVNFIWLRHVFQTFVFPL